MRLAWSCWVLLQNICCSQLFSLGILRLNEPQGRRGSEGGIAANCVASHHHGPEPKILCQQGASQVAAVELCPAAAELNPTCWCLSAALGPAFCTCCPWTLSRWMCLKHFHPRRCLGAAQTRVAAQAFRLRLLIPNLPLRLCPGSEWLLVFCGLAGPGGFECQARPE